MKALLGLHRSVNKSLRTRGWSGTARFAAVLALHWIKQADPEVRRARAQQRAAEQAFDRRYGVDTGGVIPLSKLSLNSDNWIYGAAYQAIGAGVDFEQILRQLGISCEEYTFIDLGSGKGRAVLLAAGVPFQQIIGVEFSAELHAISQRNLCRWPEAEKKCRDIKLLCMDAGEYVFPHQTFVLYMYNPFERPIMQRVIDNLVKTFNQRPRRVIVMYFTPKYSDLWAETECLEKVMERPGYHVFDTAAALSAERLSDR